MSSSPLKKNIAKTREKLSLLLVCPQKSLPQYLDSLFSNQLEGEVIFKLKHSEDIDESLAFLTQNPVDMILFEPQKNIGVKVTLSKLTHAQPRTPIIILHDDQIDLSLKKITSSIAIELIPKNNLNLLQLNHMIIRAISANYLCEETTPTSKNKKISPGKIESGDHFQNIINKSVETVIVVDEDNMIQYANESVQKLLGWPADKIIGKPLILPLVKLENKDFPHHPTTVNLRFISLLAKTNEILELTLSHSQDEDRTVQMRSSELTWNNHPAFLVALHDTTEINRLAGLTAEMSEKSKNDKLKDEFISIVSHEMRTPLTIIKGAINNLKEGIVGPISEKQNDVLETTLRNVNRLARIINDLLDLSRLESGKAVVQRRKIDIVPLIHSVIRNFSESSQYAATKFVCEIPNYLPQVFADSDMIEQVLTNLIQNALRYAKNTITVQAINENLTKKSPTDFGPTTEMVRIGIIDDGPGIPKDSLHLLFDKFNQINRPTGGGGYKGTGLGLTICKRIINLHNGKIWVDSDVGKGARFFFLLPQYHENDDFVASLETIIHKAEKLACAVGILVIRIANLPQMMENCSEQDVAFMIGHISQELHSRALRKTDFCHFKRDTKEFIIILSDTNKKIISEICKRIEMFSQQCFCPSKSGKIFAKLRTSVAVYPDDEKKPDKLLEKVYQDLGKYQE